MFKKDDIKPGYLVEIVCTKDNPLHDEGDTFYATAFNCRGPFGVDTIALVARFSNCWSVPLLRFSDALEHEYYRIDRVFGTTLPHLSFANSQAGRVLLWKRETAKRMTLEEVEKALGHPVELVTSANK